MIGKWITSRISDLGKVVTGKTPPTADSENYGGELPFITPSDMKGQKYIDRTERTISAKGRTSVKNLVIPPETVFVSCIGSDMGKVGMTRVESVTNQQINSIIVRDDIDPDYIYYNLYSRKDELQRLATSGSAQPILNKGHFSQLKVSLPQLPEQKAIASILGSLDDKIELNRRMNETLEAMARAIFKSWFVDFDPVRAKAEGRDTGLPMEVADLFPASFETSALGEMPRGWMMRPLPEIMRINPTRSLSKGTLAPYLDMANMPTQGPSPDICVMREMGSGMKFKNGDTLVARITPCLENGKTAFVDFLANDEVGWGSTEYIVLRPKGMIPPLFAYLLARTDKFRTFAIQQMTGSSGRQRVPAASLEKYRIVTPDIDSPLYQHFGTLVSPMFDRIKAAMMQSRILAAIRDSLLPKLISGEIRIKDAEKFVVGIA